ncbi:MAG: tetratricopeptide repeat protein [Planctomycetes bacterium]|nr:tetratricopeptide repeat protein [Planctomycetota bacterium]
MNFRNFLALWLLFTGVLLAVYAPALHGTPIWDDEAHMIHEDQADATGLRNIWIPGVTQQYYPVVCSAFWVQNKLWGDQTLGYHVVNIMLHAFISVMVGTLLGRMLVPGAWLAAAVFALHPVHTESVAWISELKNVMSGSFYMLALACYLRFRPVTQPASPSRDDDASGPKAFYAIAFALYVAAILSKSVTASLPAAILLLTWWRRGRLGLVRDVLPTIPFFLTGACMSVVTALVEKKNIGPRGNEFLFTFAERCLIAGRDVWFYAQKLVWPTNLVFVYPRWKIDAHDPWQWAYPAGAALLILTMSLLVRRWGRGPLTAVLFFGGTLLPALGFVHVYPFRYSFVADHFQYLASLGVIALISCSYATLLRGAANPVRMIGYAGAAAVVALLGVLTSLQSRTYADAASLWETTIARNPNAIMAYINQGLMYQNNASKLLLVGKQNEAMEQLARAEQTLLRARVIEPENPDPPTNLSLVYHAMGRNDEALAAAETAIRLGDVNSEAHLNKVLALAQMGRTKEAIDTCYHALKTDGNNAKVYNSLGALYAGLGMAEKAFAMFKHALEVGPKDPDGESTYANGMVNLAISYEDRAQYGEAVKLYQRAIRIRPGDAELHLLLGNDLEKLGRHQEAAAAWSKALRLAPAGGHTAIAAENKLGVMGRKP